MEDRQQSHPNGVHKPPTLISSLRRAFATQVGCEVSQTVSKMWEVLSCTGFDDLDEEIMLKIIGGGQVGRGMKRIF